MKSMEWLYHAIAIMKIKILTYHKLLINIKKNFRQKKEARSFP